MSASVRDHLIAARALIDTPEKWMKGSYHSQSTGCLCALGALGVAAHGDAYDWEYVDAKALLSVLRPDDEDWLIVVDFNDHPDTTHADVMAWFDRAIAAQEPSDAP